MNRIGRRCKILISVGQYLIEMAFAYIAALPLRLGRKHNPIWLISERGQDARDNGYFFFQWLRCNHPEVNAYYVIQKSSADFQKVNAVGKTVEPNSFLHYVLFAASKYRISTHAWGGDIPKADYFKKLRLYRLSRKRFAFLQHGITKDFQPGLCYPQIAPDLFVCGAEPEYAYVNTHFGHADGVVQYTGLARYDNLNNVKTKKQILFMPTFRKWLQRDDREQFLTEEYYSRWQSVLDNEALRAILQKKDLELVFYPHFEVQRFVDCFHSQSPHIKIAAFEDYDVQRLLIESKLLVTDFSSVFFDFAYMNKPLYYYQFDRNRYIREHYDYTAGYFDYDQMGFGQVCLDETHLVDELMKCINDNFPVEPVYRERRDAFFPFSDSHNCERIFDAVINLE